MNKKKKTFIIAVASIIIAAAVAAAYFITEKYREKPVEETDGSHSVETTVLAKYAEYYSKNNDFVGWIKIDGTNVDYPVVKTDNNDFYLDHNFDKEYEGRGSIFMAEDCDPDLKLTNTVIHGHNWLDGTNFSDLVQYSDFDYYKKHPVIEYDTRTKLHKWKIFAVFITTGSDFEDNGYVFNYVYPDLTGQNFTGYMNEINKRTLFNTGVDVNENDKILTLSTCTREVDTPGYRTDCRIVIAARMVRDGEAQTVDTSKARINENPKYPQIWYDLKNQRNPYYSDEKWYPQEYLPVTEAQSVSQ